MGTASWNLQIMGNLVFQMIKKHLAFHGHPRERYCNSWLFIVTLETLAGVLACVDGHPGRQTRAGCHFWLNPAFLKSSAVTHHSGWQALSKLARSMWKTFDKGWIESNFNKKRSMLRMEEQQELQDTATTSRFSKLPPIDQIVAVTPDSKTRSMASLYCIVAVPFWYSLNVMRSPSVTMKQSWKHYSCFNFQLRDPADQWHYV